MLENLPSPQYYLNDCKTIDNWMVYEMGNMKLHYTRNKDLEGNIVEGFKGFAYEEVAWKGDGSDECIHCQLIIKVSCAFDGVRHLHFGDERSNNEGYLYCPDIGKLMELLNEIDILTSLFCNEDQLN